MSKEVQWGRLIEWQTETMIKMDEAVQPVYDEWSKFVAAQRQAPNTYQKAVTDFYFGSLGVPLRFYQARPWRMSFGERLCSLIQPWRKRKWGTALCDLSLPDRRECIVANPRDRALALSLRNIERLYAWKQKYFDHGRMDQPALITFNFRGCFA